jgi:hypothetical protein
MAKQTIPTVLNKKPRVLFGGKILRVISKISGYNRTVETQEKSRGLRIFDLPRDSCTFYDNGKIVRHTSVEEVSLFLTDVIYVKAHVFMN